MDNLGCRWDRGAQTQRRRVVSCSICDGFLCSYRPARNTTSEDEVMEPRFDMFDNKLATKFSKRFANSSVVIGSS